MRSWSMPANQTQWNLISQESISFPGHRAFSGVSPRQWNTVLTETSISKYMLIFKSCQNSTLREGDKVSCLWKMLFCVTVWRGPQTSWWWGLQKDQDWQRRCEFTLNCGGSFVPKLYTWQNNYEPKSLTQSILTVLNFKSTDVKWECSSNFYWSG